ncbi:unnamed protein product [Rodentolepis nana]|uniref:PDZ domain-containing protein n=1 Tax=Rodentolepis nana TaxID=102285 RepID=A0A0R3T8G1_RODNA|nr:unnamed protein product [Rodentolepis nana]
MNHGSSSRPNFLFATSRHLDADRSLHQMCLSPDCVSANIPPPQLPQSSPKEGFSSILSFWADIEQSSSRSTSITMPRLNPSLTNGLSRSRVGGGINHLSSGTTSDMDSISNSTSSRQQKNEPLKPSRSEESSDIDNFSTPYELIVPPKPSKTPKPMLATPQTKVFQPPNGIGYGEYANISKNGHSLPPPLPSEMEDSPPILPPKSPLLRPVSQDNRILFNGIQTMPRLNGNSLKSNEPKPPSPLPAKLLPQNGKSNHNEPVMANGNTRKSNFNRFSPNFRYSFNRPLDEPSKISTARSISAYGAVRESTPELPIKSTSKRPATAMTTNIGVFQVRYPTMSMTHTPAKVPIVRVETYQNGAQPLNYTPVLKRSSSRGGESSFQRGRESRFSLRTNGCANVAPYSSRNSRSSSEMRHQHSTKSISNRSGGDGFGGNTDTSSVSPNHSDENLVTVTIRPNAEGHYGFNVSGGADLKRPVVVSRVGDRMPAATCCPRLHAGDQIIRINYRDISDYTQEQVSFLFPRLLFQSDTTTLLCISRVDLDSIMSWLF